MADDDDDMCGRAEQKEALGLTSLFSSPLVYGVIKCKLFSEIIFKHQLKPSSCRGEEKIQYVIQHHVSLDHRHQNESWSFDWERYSALHAQTTASQGRSKTEHNAF